MRRARTEIVVGWGDCDPAGIVFYPNYLRWFDFGTLMLLGEVGLTMQSLAARFDGACLPLLSVESKFSHPVRPTDRLMLVSEIVEWRKSTLAVAHVIRCGDHVAADGRELRIWAAPDPTHPKGLRASAIPDAFKALFA